MLNNLKITRRKQEFITYITVFCIHISLRQLSNEFKNVRQLLGRAKIDKVCVPRTLVTE